MLSPMNHPLCAIIIGPTFETALQQVQEAGASLANMLEFRLDLFTFTQEKSLLQLRQASSLPVIFTLRKASHGGRYDGSEGMWISLIRRLVTLKPDYFDLECDTPPEFFVELREMMPDLQLICSMHDFERTPNDLNAVFRVMRQCPAKIYKIATMAHSALDAMRMLQFVKEQTSLGRQLVGMCLGASGQITRILGGVFGNAFTYAVLDDSRKIAPGQLTLKTLSEVYYCNNLHKNTKILGLIGDPVAHSPSHLTHNVVLRELDLEGIYVKIKVSPYEVQDFLKLANTLQFQGLSVTMPLKEIVLGDSNVINTLVLTQEGNTGYNTDGVSVVELLKEKIDLNHKRVVLIGAGGTAKGIASALKNLEVEIVVLNRNLDRALKLALDCGGTAYSLKDFPVIAAQGYDILINCTSIGMAENGSSSGNLVPISEEYLLPGRIVMDAVLHPRETPLLVAAKKKNCTLIHGHEMFIRQASKQFSLWFGVDVQSVSAILTKLLK